MAEVTEERTRNRSLGPLKCAANAQSGNLGRYGQLQANTLYKVQLAFFVLGSFIVRSSLLIPRSEPISSPDRLNESCLWSPAGASSKAVM